MNRSVGPFFFEIAKGIGKAFGLDAGDWIVIILTLILLAVVAIIICAIGVIIITSIKDYFHNIDVRSIEKSHDYNWFEKVMVQICGDTPVPITIDTKNSTIQFSPIEKLNYSCVIGGDKMTISLDKNAILLKPTATEEDIKKHIGQFRDDYKSLLLDSAVKDIEGNVVSDYYDKYLVLIVIIQKDSINNKFLPLLNKAILSFVEKTTHNKITKRIKILPNETQEDFKDKIDIAFSKIGIVIPTENLFIYFSSIEREEVIELYEASFSLYLNENHPLSKQKDEIELVLDELEKSQQEEYNKYEEERIRRKNIEEFFKLYGNQPPQEVVMSSNTVSDNYWKWWFIGGLIILIGLLFLLFKSRCFSIMWY